MTTRSEIRLLRFALPHVRSVVFVLATSAAGVVFEIAKPWPIKILADNVLGGKRLPRWLATPFDALPGPSTDRSLLVWTVVALVAVFLVSTGLTMANTLAAVRLGQRMTYDVGAAMFLHLQRLSLLFHIRRPVGDTISRVTVDPSSVQLVVTSVLLPGLQAVVMVVLMFVVMWALEPTLTLLALGVIPFLLVVIRLYARPMKRYSRARRDLEGEMTSVIETALTAIPAVQAFNRAELEHQRFVTYADETVAAYSRSTAASMKFKLFAGLVTTLGTAALMLVGGLYALDGTVTIGTILVFISYLASLYTPLNNLAYTTSTLQQASAQADRVLEILDAEPDVNDAHDAKDVELRGHVRFEDVTFGYEPDRPVFESLSFEARPGETIAIVGPSGAGKTTLVNLVVRFFDPWSGRVTIDGLDVREIRLRSLREQVALVLQEPFIFPITIAENIAYGRPGASVDEIVEAARAANAHDFIMRLPYTYYTDVSERGATLSGGEKQRLSIARAFLKDAPILILDEPTSALDARTETLLLEALRRLMAGRLTFIIAHRLSTIRDADRILVLDRGRIVEQGRHEELLGQGGLYASLWSQQAGGERENGVLEIWQRGSKRRRRSAGRR